MEMHLSRPSPSSLSGSRDAPACSQEDNDSLQSAEQSWFGWAFNRCLSTTRELCRTLVSSLSRDRNQTNASTPPPRLRARRSHPYPLPQERYYRQAARPQNSASSGRKTDESALRNSPEHCLNNFYKAENQLNPNAKLVDLTTIDLEDYLVPSRLPPGVATYIGEQVANNQENIIEKVPPEVKTLSGGKHFEKLTKCAYVLSDIRRLIPAFSVIGYQLLTLCNQYHPDTPLKISPVETFCKIYKSNIRGRYKLPGLSVRAGRIAGQQKYRFTDERVSALPDVFSYDLIIAALEQICSDGLSPRNAPIFLGYIRKEFANEWATPHGFIESDSSPNYAHGEWSHLIQLASLNWMGVLSPSCIEIIIKNNLWNTFFDNNHYRSFYLHELPQKGEDKNICGFPMTLLADSPTVIHEKLSTGQISSALEKILNDSKLETYLPELAVTLNLTSLTKDELETMIDNIRFLEMAIACRSLKNKEYAEAFRKYEARSLEVVIPGDFYSESEMTIKASQHRAHQHFKEGDRVFGYYKKKGYSSSTSCYRPVHSEQDIDLCNAFVVIPKGSSRRPPAHTKT